MKSKAMIEGETEGIVKYIVDASFRLSVMLCIVNIINGDIIK